MKKMRKLIPALSMLMVAAIMLTTASFAWFTMNDQVTATGMQVQAKAAGNLLISRDKMSSTSKDIKADFSDISKVTLKPSTFVDGAWKTVGSDVVVDPLYGTIDANAELSDIATDEYGHYFYEQVVYLATAGTKYTAPITMTIDPAFATDDFAAYAYTVAISVGDTADWENPDIRYSVAEKAGRVNGSSEAIAEKTTTDSFEIPSTEGTTASTAVGLKVSIRIYVDGALSAGTTTAKENVIKEMNYSASTLYDADAMATWTFYRDADGKGEVEVAFVDGVTDLNELGITHYWDGETTKDVTHAYNYINNSKVPAAGTVFSVTFKATDPSNSNG